MSLALLLARVALALVFAVAAVGKLSDREAFRGTIEQFGLPRRAARPAAWALPITELVIALGLLFITTAWAAAVAASVLLALFCIAIVSVIARGEAPECNCFGSLGSARVGRSTLARNGILLALSLFVIVAGHDQAGTSAFAWVGHNPTLASLVSLATAAIAAQAAFSWQLFKQNGRLLVRVADLEAASTSQASGGPLEVGSPAPAFALPDLDGNTITLDDILAPGRGALLFFTHPGCGYCETVLPSVAAAQVHDSSLPIAVISTGNVEPNRARATDHGLDRILLQKEYEVSEQYGVRGMPGAVLLDPQGLIASDSVEGTVDVAELLAGLVPAKAPAPHAAGGRRGLYREVVAR